jgi:UTP--glucose-1-phosphate uridylyltransferase
MTVRKAVIPAAGLGTRFLPATKASPKEMVTVVDRPAIQYVVEEAARAGIDDVLIITGRGKSPIADHFDRSIELERALEAKGDVRMLETLRAISELADIHFVRQKEPLGLGHAVLQAKRHVGREPFAVLLPDEIIPDDEKLLESLIGVYERYGRSVVAVMEVPHDEIRFYGAVKPEPVEENLVRMLDFVEKPEPKDAPSNLGSFGRYVLAPEVFDELERTEPGTGGEIQLTDAINALAKRQTVYAYIFDGRRFDIGRTPGFLRATVELAADRTDVGEGFRDFLGEFALRKKLV